MLVVALAKVSRKFAAPLLLPLSPSTTPSASHCPLLLLPPLVLCFMTNTFIVQLE